MFVRFRQAKSDGREPIGVSAKMIRVREWRHGTRRPRSRWRIGIDEGIELVPYRLHITLAENRRVSGKVKQEHVADLGSIDGVFIPSFWEGLTPHLLDKVRGKDWERRSLRARVDFWERAKPRLDRLANRLGPELKRFRMTINAHVPWPKEPERAKLALLEAEDELARASGSYEFTSKMVKTSEKIIANETKRNAELKNLAFYEVRTVTAAAEKVKRLKEKK